MKFSDLTQQVQEKASQIIQLPFNQELANGILPKKKFCYYLQQDAFYLIKFSKALAITATKLEQPAHIEAFYRFALKALSAERGLHQDYLSQYDVTMSNIQANKTCNAYTNFLLDHATHSEAIVSIAALLPCFWVYQVVGQAISKTSKPNNVYQNWINMYSSNDFKTSVDRVIDLFELLSEKVSADVLFKIENAFVNAVDYECCFWEKAYNLEKILV